MNDWAKDIANDLVSYGGDASEMQIASALRAAEKRGRVAGLREAQTIADNLDGCMSTTIWSNIKDAADNLKADTP